MKLVRVAALAAVVGFGVMSAACGEGSGAKSAHITPGPMPDGESWTGVYYHPVFGYLHMVEQDANVVGRWKRTDGSAWGELSGTQKGNVLHFTWKERTYGMVGPAAERKGRGYFVYRGPKREGEASELDGEYGNDDVEVGSSWHNVKQVRMQPDLKSIGGGTPEESVQPGGLE